MAGYGQTTMSPDGMNPGHASEPWSQNIGRSKSPPQVLQHTVSSTSQPSVNSPAGDSADGASDHAYTDIVGKLNGWYHGSRYSADELWKSALGRDSGTLRKCLKAGLGVNYCRFVREKGVGCGVRSVADIVAARNDTKSMQVLLEFRVDLSGSVSSALANHSRLRTSFLLTAKAKNFQIQEDDIWTTPLHEACHSGRLEMLDMLLDAGVNPNVLDNQQRTALFLASQKKKTDLAQKLLLKGASIEMSKANGISPLAVAALTGNMEIVKLLLAHGARVDTADNRGETPCYNASLVGHYDVLNLLVTYGADVNVRNTLGASPFFSAASKFKIDTMDALIKCGSDVNSSDTNGCTALLRAVMGKNVPLLVCLLSKGADIDRMNNSGWTPLFAAMIHGDDSVVQILLSNGCDLHTPDRHQNSPLHQASMLDSVITVRYIISAHRGASINLSPDNVNGETPLALACKYNNSAIVRVLLQYGVEPRHRGKNGFTALDQAMYHGSYACARLLLEANVDIDNNTIQCLQQGLFDYPNSSGHEMTRTFLRNRYGINVFPNTAPSAPLKMQLALNVTRDELLVQMRSMQTSLNATASASNNTTSGVTPHDTSIDPFEPPVIELNPELVASTSKLGTGNAVKLGAVAGAAVGEVVVNQLATNLTSTLLGL